MKLFEGMRGIEGSLDYHMERHGVLSSNLTNAETPGYRPRDLVFEAELEQAQLERTDPGHLPDSSESKNYTLEEGGPVGHDKNGVRLEKAMAQISANRLRYETSAEIARRRLAMLRYAATDGSQ